MEQRGKGRARGRARDTAPPAAGQRPPQQPGAWGPSQRPPTQRPGGPDPSTQRPAPVPQQSAWGARPAPPQQQLPRGPPQQPMQAGRASYRAAGDSASAPGPEATVSGTVYEAGDSLASHGRGAIRGRRQPFECILRTRPDQLATKQGNYGSPIQLTANYFKLVNATDWNLHQYRVDFAPEEDRTTERKRLLRIATREMLAGYLFDGTVLYMTNRINPDPMELFVQSEGGETYRITIKLVGDVAAGDFHRLQIFNLILRKAMSTLKLQTIGRNFFDAVAKISIPEHKLELWPGYITSIRQHEEAILLCVEITTKVMRMDTVLHLLIECSKEDRANYKTAFQTKIIGSVVLTDYNNRTYRIDDVDWNSNPRSTFQKADGSSISYMEYYASRYNLQIRDINQPLLVSRSKAREIRAGMPETILLIPELCRMTGLTDAQRANFQLMRALANHTRVGPPQRMEKLYRFSQRLANNEALKQLKEWDLTLANQLVQFAGRSLPPETVLAGQDVKYSAGKEADWTRELRSRKMFYEGKLNEWAVLTPGRCRPSAQNFISLLKKAADGMNWPLPYPKIHEIRSDHVRDYIEGVEHLVNNGRPDLIMCVVTNNKADRYAAIKKKCSVDRAYPTQMILAKNLDAKGAMSIATKVAIQMNCKVGGAPWSVQIPMSGLMVVGYDVCHDPTDRQKSFGAMVASLDKQITRYFNTASAHTSGEELSNDFALNLIKACKTYQEINKKLPDRIIIYRDGVGDGQLQYVIEHEVELIKKKLGEALYPENTLKLTFIVVSKRINTRIFAGQNNPPPGTVIDSCVTLPERYDFFIVSQCVKQGTVSPTSYNVISDNSGLAADHLQRLTYKLTHLYYNWSGTVRVPAPCQYAHKLAFLAGQTLHRPPHRDLETVLHFL